jgi:hypothetical protein
MRAAGSSMMESDFMGILKSHPVISRNNAVVAEQFAWRFL